jgi:hypothetical protein
VTVVEVDDLRKILRAREPLAPEPEVVFAAADRRFRRVRARRRVAGAAAAVVVITAGLSVGLGLARQQGPAAPAPAPLVPAAAAPPDTLLVPASLPFSIDSEHVNAQLVTWQIDGHNASARYHWGGRTITVEVSDTDPVGAYDAPVLTTYQIDGAKAVLQRSASAATQQLSWTPTPGKWVAITTDPKTSGLAETVFLAEYVRLTPQPIPTLIRSLRVPPGLTVTSRGGAGSGETLILCPIGDAATAAAAAAGKRPDCVVVTADKGRANQQGLPAVTPLPASQRNEVVDGITLRVSDNGRTVLRQFADQWILVGRASGDLSVLPRVATSAVMN